MDAVHTSGRPLSSRRPAGSVAERGHPRAAGDPVPPHCEVIEVHVADLKQLFNAIDPSPFREKDLAPEAEEFIVAWASEAALDASLALVVYVDRPADPSEGLILHEAVSQFFRQRADAARRRLRQLFRRGRTSLAIGVTCLTASLLIGDAVSYLMAGHRLDGLLRESLLIGGWVAMWRPLEVFLYDWWPIRADARLADRLSAMPVRIAVAG